MCPIHTGRIIQMPKKWRFRAYCLPHGVIFWYPVFIYFSSWNVNIISVPDAATNHSGKIENAIEVDLIEEDQSITGKYVPQATKKYLDVY